MRLENRTATPVVFMRGVILTVLAGGCALSVLTAHGQETNPCPLIPRTKLEAFETNTGVLIIKGTTHIGMISGQAGGAEIKCKEITDSSTGHREYGISVEIAMRGQEEIALVDYDEIGSLLAALDSLNKLEWSNTSVDYDAMYTTKGGLRLVVFGRIRSGTLQFAIRYSQGGGQLLITRDQMAQFRSLIAQAKNKLDSLRTQK